MKTITLTFFLLASTINSNAQSNILIDNQVLGTNFFIAILAGVLLALMFQIIFTSISVAFGISMIGDLKENFIKNRVRPEGNVAKENNTFNQDYTNHDQSMGMKISNGFGIWSTLTTCLSLFGACALALNLNYFGNFSANITVSLVIWALFFIILFYLETRIVNTVLGGLVSTATSGLKSTAAMIKGFFETSEQKKIEHVLSDTVEKVRKEFDFDTSEVASVLDAFLNKVDNKLPDYDTIKKDLSVLVEKGKSKNTAGKWMAIQQVLTKVVDEASSDSNHPDKDRAQNLRQILSELKAAYTNEGDTVDNIKNVIADHTPLEKSQMDEAMNSVKDFISNATPEKFSVHGLSESLKEMLSKGQDIVAHMDRKTIIQALSKNTNLDKKDLENYADRIEKSIKSSLETVQDFNMESFKKSIEDYASNFLNETHRKELDYDDLKRDLNRMLDNPKESFSIIKARISKFDADTVKALVTNNKYIDEKQIDNITDSINSAINSVKEKVTAIEQKAHEEMEMLKRKAVIQAEHARETAASAAWWLVVTVMTSAAAAMLGGWVELM